MEPISPAHMHVLRHALGVKQYRCHTVQTPSGPRGFRWSKSYRNHFEAGDKDAGLCARLAELGLMDAKGNWYWVTERGKAVATEGMRWGRKWGYEL